MTMGGIGGRGDGGVTRSGGGGRGGGGGRKTVGSDTFAPNKSRCTGTSP